MQIYSIKHYHIYLEIEDLDNDILKTSVIHNLKEVYNSREATDLEFVEKTILEFCRNQTLKNAILKSRM